MPYEGIGNQAEEATAQAIKSTLGMDLDDLYPARDAASAIEIEVVENGEWQEDFMVNDDAPYERIADAVFDHYLARDRRFRPLLEDLLVHVYGIRGIGTKIEGDDRGTMYERQHQPQDHRN